MSIAEVWPDLAKFHHFGNFLRGKFYDNKQILIVENVQIFKWKKTM